uniref:EOG090X0FS7 n=1 Tax=Ceriodaphnia reticulata TaxID=302197 RepID=A0A4Y7LY85_9CRUS|nr:EOG090X0FS7 [Ceriodaphnia reticulata]
MEDSSKTSRQPSFNENLPLVNDRKEVSSEKEEETLLQRKKEIENMIQKMSTSARKNSFSSRFRRRDISRLSTETKNGRRMSDSENESSSESLQHDLMSVSDQEGDASRDEDDMPSAEADLSEGAEQIDAGRDEDSIPTDSTSNEELAQMHAIEGTVMKEGDMIHFIAKNLETKIRLSSPDISENSQLVRNQSESTRPGLPSAAPESTFLALLEREARCIAASVDGLTEHLAVSLHTISAVTAQSLIVYKDSVCKTCDAMDANIKSMYQLMAKCEELSKSMTPIYKLSEQVKEIKKLLDIMENLS